MAETLVRLWNDEAKLLSDPVTTDFADEMSAATPGTFDQVAFVGDVPAADQELPGEIDETSMSAPHRKARRAPPKASRGRKRAPAKPADEGERSDDRKGDAPPEAE